MIAFMPAIAMALGVGAGLLLGLSATKWLIARGTHSSRVASAIGGALSVLPAMFFSIIVGGTAGGGFGEAILGKSGIAVGLAIGIAAILGAGISLGAIVGNAIGRLTGRTCQGEK